MSTDILTGDCVEVMAAMEPASVDAVVTDPPYELGFMNRAWDSTGVAYQVKTWRAAYRVLKPGGHLLAFGGSRTYHRMACAVEDAGFEVRDQIMWLYGSGFPKSHNVSKAIDKAAGAKREVVSKNPNHRALKPTIAMCGEPHTGDGSITAPATDAARQWHGWGTALKPAHEPIVVARKPLIGTVAANVLKHGTGALNVDRCRVAGDVPSVPQPEFNSPTGAIYGMKTGEGRNGEMSHATGRWPANVILDEEAGAMLDEQSGVTGAGKRTERATPANRAETYGGFDMCDGKVNAPNTYAGKGGASRFFYCPKASRKEREAGMREAGLKEDECQTGCGGDMPVDDSGKERDRFKKRAANHHPTVKPVELMRYLIRLVTPPGGTVLDPFLGSGTTLMAATLEGVDAIGIEREAEYVEIAKARVKWAEKQPVQMDIQPSG